MPCIPAGHSHKGSGGSQKRRSSRDRDRRRSKSRSRSSSRQRDRRDEGRSRSREPHRRSSSSRLDRDQDRHRHRDGSRGRERGGNDHRRVSSQQERGSGRSPPRLRSEIREALRSTAAPAAAEGAPRGPRAEERAQRLFNSAAADLEPYEARVMINGVQRALNTQEMRGTVMNSDRRKCEGLEDYSQVEMFTLGALWAAVGSGRGVLYGRYAGRKLNRALEHIETLLEQEGDIVDGIYRFWLMGAVRAEAEEAAAQQSSE